MTAIKYHQAASLSGTRHGFFTRFGGVSSGLYDSLNLGLGSQDEPAHVQENRDRVRQALGAKDLVTAHQSHSVVTAFIDAPQTGLPADALVTATPGLAIGALAADCAPILLADVEARLIGAAHSGWRGAFDGIAASVVDTLCQHGARRAHIKAVVGPCISQDAYEVGPEFIARFQHAFADDLDLFLPSPNHKPAHHMFDLPRFVSRQLRRSGLAEAHVSQMGLCTYAQANGFFSYRRTTHQGEPDYGRQISAICLP
ncbi:MAG: peptidoglycan editing factor PgeF [Rhodobiaceae bacterium]|nr:peptidoglycan editing factor PgeF [Rhodobiaceae bacterium]MBT7280474.1 peptidoglycan editing factor PgeF [Rhodobiaceae bacterium]